VIQKSWTTVTFYATPSILGRRHPGI